MLRENLARLYDWVAGEASGVAIPGSLARTLGKQKQYFDIACYPCYYAIMIINFADQGTEDVFNGKNSSRARKKCPNQVWSVAQRKLDQLDSATELKDLAVPPGNRLEALSGDRQGQHSIRINDQYRICFIWTKSDPVDVEITDSH